MVPDNEGGSPSPFGTSMTMEEIEANAGETTEKPDLSKITAPDADDVPEAYRGKSFADVIKIAEGARGAMNDATKAAQEARDAATRAEATRREAPVQQVEAPKELTREELKALYDEDPLAAIAKIEEQAERRMSAHLENRLSAITEGTVGQAENWARQEFADEFELFGDEIKGMVDKIPNKQVFASKQGWQDAVAFIRGKSGNFEKLVAHRMNKDNQEAGRNARQSQRDTAGFSGRTTAGASRGNQVSDSEAAKDMSAEERAIAQRFIDDGTFKDLAEYKKWQR